MDNSATAGIVGTKPTLVSAAGIYQQGPIYAAIAYERHNDYFGLNAMSGGFATATKIGTPGLTTGATGSKDDGWRVGGGYTFPTGTTINGIWERLRYQNNDATAGDLTGYQRSAWYIAGMQKVGAITTLKATYGRANDGSCSANGACSTYGQGAKMYSAGATFDLSKFTSLYAIYAVVKNDGNGTYNYGSGAIGTAGTTYGAGSELKSFGLGIRKVF